MPAGVSWSRYLIFFSAAMLTMFAGAQTIHIMYNPLNDFDKYLEDMHKEMQKKKDKQQNAKGMKDAE